MVSRYQEGERASWIVLIGNILLTLLKAVIGVTASSAALLADAVHSGSDALSTIVVILGMRIARKPADTKHPYGHSRAETVAAKVLSIILLLLGLNMAVTAVRSLWQGGFRIPGVAAIWAVALSIAVKEAMFHYSIRVAQRINSSALRADAWHHRSDSLSSAAALIGILLARLGWLWADPLVAGVVSLVVVRVGWQIFSSAVDEMMDAQAEPELLDAVANAVSQINDVQSFHGLRVHRYGSELHVDLTVTAPSSYSLSRGHSLVHKVRDSIGEHLPNATHIDVHVEPESSSS